MSWKDELSQAGVAGSWSWSKLEQAVAEIARLPDADDWDPPGSFWLAAAQVVGRVIGALPGATSLIDTWVQRGVTRGTNWTDGVDDAITWAADSTKASIKEGLKVVAETNPIVMVSENIATVAEKGEAIVNKGAEVVPEVVEDLRDIGERTNNTARMIALPLLGLAALLYFGSKKGG